MPSRLREAVISDACRRPETVQVQAFLAVLRGDGGSLRTEAERELRSITGVDPPEGSTDWEQVVADWLQANPR